jgi:hypothetical protein
MAPKPHQVVHGLLTIKLEDHVSRKEKKCRGLAMLWVQWNVEDFGEKLSLKSSTLDIHRDITSKIVSKDDLVTYFGKRSSPNGWKVKTCDLLSAKDCLAILTLYETIYVHPPSNGDYFGIFLKGWLAKKKGHNIN